MTTISRATILQPSFAFNVAETFSISDNKRDIKVELMELKPEHRTYQSGHLARCRYLLRVDGNFQASFLNAWNSLRRFDVGPTSKADCLKMLEAIQGKVNLICSIESASAEYMEKGREASAAASMQKAEGLRTWFLEVWGVVVK